VLKSGRAFKTCALKYFLLCPSSAVTRLRTVALWKIIVKVDSKDVLTSHFSTEMPRQQGTQQHKKDYDSKNTVKPHIEKNIVAERQKFLNFWFKLYKHLNININQ
jgi:hypothetical protein